MFYALDLNAIKEEVVCLSSESGNGLSNSVLQTLMTYW